MEMSTIIEQYGAWGVVLLMGWYLFRQFVKEKGEDRELYKKSVEDFNQTIKDITKELNRTNKSVDEIKTDVENLKETTDEIKEKINQII